MVVALHHTPTREEVNEDGHGDVHEDGTEDEGAHEDEQEGERGEREDEHEHEDVHEGASCCMQREDAWSPYSQPLLPLPLLLHDVHSDSVCLTVTVEIVFVIVQHVDVTSCVAVVAVNVMVAHVSDVAAAAAVVAVVVE